MTLSRWLSVAIFALAIVAAYQLAKPDPVPAQQTAPGFNTGDSVNTRQLMPPRVINDPPPPIKISGDPKLTN